MEPKHSLTLHASDRDSPDDLTRLQGEINGMNSCIERILNLVGEQGDALSKKALIEKDENAYGKPAGTFELKRSELIAQVRELCQMHKSLSDQYITSSNKSRELSSGKLASDHDQYEATFSTPEHREGPGPMKHSLQVNQSGGSSYNLSKGNSEPISWSPSSDSEVESCYLSTNRSSFREMDDDFEPRSYFIWSKDQLGGKEMHICSQEEADMLKLEPVSSATKNEDERANMYELAELTKKNVELVEDLKATRERLLVSQEQVTTLEHSLGKKIDEATQQLQHKIETANDTINMLEAELKSERSLSAELSKVITKYKNDLADRDLEVQNLMFALTDAHENLFKVKSSLESDINLLSNQQNLLLGRLEDAELRNRSLEEQFRRYEAEKMEMHDVHEAEKECLLTQIDQLKAEILQKSEQVDALNKSVDASRIECCMIMAEKDGETARVQTLGAEVNEREIEIRQMGDWLSRLQKENEGLVSGAGSAEKQISELRVKVAELEKKVVQQRVVISERAEEKREAIRQLCLSLEYYRNEYHELRLFFPGHKQLSAVRAS